MPSFSYRSWEYSVATLAKICYVLVSLPLLFNVARDRLSFAALPIDSGFGIFPRMSVFGHRDGSIDHALDPYDNLTLSKLFANSMQPSRVIPYYYRASHGFTAEDITITTLATVNRFHILADLAQSYHGTLDCDTGQGTRNDMCK